MNSYTAFFSRHLEGLPQESDYRGNVEFLNEDKEARTRGPETDTHWLRMSPWGWAKLLRWIWARYQVPICLTENRTTVKGEHENMRPTKPDEILEDPFRVEFSSRT